MRLKGWVENLPDGSVRTIINGDMQNCIKFINWCRTGNAYSWVEDIDVSEMIAEDLSPFEIRY